MTFVLRILLIDYFADSTGFGHSLNLTDSLASEISIAEGLVSPEEIIKCFVKRTPIQITAFNGSVSMDDQTLRKSGLTGSSYKCLLKIIPPRGHFTAFTPVYIRACGGEYDVVMNNTVFSCTYMKSGEWQHQNTSLFGNPHVPVSYTHLTLPTNREV
eukprot:TRINITY_DN68725_c0_g1_i1.p1 TRINITY_DN68725_c0_g1~~TRINITY_DN68725_c0_g1_i1.p1  ORF type:complete len:157 (-),score=14.82 TRINITY_DN68725_c0_g1_i1:7-477(-)